MIVFSFFVDFCILVKKGISLLFYGLFLFVRTMILTPISIIKYAIKGLETIGLMLFKTTIIVWKGFKYLFKVVVKAIEYVITALWKLFKKIIDYFIKLLIKPLINFILYLLLYAIYGIKVLIKLIFDITLNTIKYAISGVNILLGFVKILWHYVGEGIRTIFAFILYISRYFYNSFRILFVIIYKFFYYVFNGFIDVSILIYHGVTFIPKLIIKGIIKFLTNFKDIIHQVVIAPIQNGSDWIEKTYKLVKSRLLALPENIKKAFLKWWDNLTFVKHYRNKRDMNRQVLLIDFNSKDAKRSDKKIVWQYYAKDKAGKIVRGTFEAFSKVDVHSFLMSEGYEVYDIKTSKWIEMLYGNFGGTSVKVKPKKLIFFLTQLSTYIKAGIPLTDSVRILSNQEKDSRMKRLYQSIMYELIMGENFSTALEKQGDSFPKLLVNMLKTSEMTGELAGTLDDMSDYYSTTHKLRKQTITSMMYPITVLFFVIVVVVFIMIFVIPQFIEIYKNSDSELPQITIATIAVSDFLQNNILLLIGGIAIFAIVFRLLFKHVKLFKTVIQYIIMHIPVVKNIIIYNEITMFTKTFSSLLEHNVYITDSMEILSKITNNEIYKMVVFDSISSIAKGDSISSSFKNNWAVPPLAYEMMLTGERTGQLPLMMGKVATYYQEEQKNLVSQVKALVEPIVIVVLAGVVGLILLAVVVPMFSLYGDISGGV